MECLEVLLAIIFKKTHFINISSTFHQHLLSYLTAQLQLQQNNLLQHFFTSIQNMLPQDQLRLAICLVLSVFFSYGMSKIKYPTIFIAISFITSIVFQLYVYRSEVIFLWTQQVIVYCLCRWAPRKSVGKIVLVQTFVYLLAIQIRRMYVAYGKNDIDITAILMMQVFLYVGFAFNYQDGLNERSTSPRKITQFPPVTEFIGYVSFMPAALVGPVFEFKDYQNYLHRKQNYSTLPENTWPGILRELKTFGFILVVYFTLLSFSLDHMLTQQYADSNIVYKIIYLTIAIFAFRFKYYLAWSLGMLSMNATGITYNGQKDDKGNLIHNWNRIEVSDIWSFECQQSMKKKADAWNKSVQLALKRYIYERIYAPIDSDSQKIKKSKQQKAQSATLFTSAIWHGLYPGYFVSFFHWGLLLQISQELFRIERQSQTWKNMRKQFRILELLVVNFFLGYFGVSFVYMSWDNIWKFFGAMYFAPVIIVYVGYIVVVRMGYFSRRKREVLYTPDEVKEQVKVKDEKKSN